MGTLEERRTARMLLTRIKRTDLDDLVRMYRDPSVMATLGGLIPDAESMRRGELNLAHWMTHGFGRWIMRDLETECFIGRGGLQRILIEGRLETELGYGLVPQFWGQGLATELAEESVRVGFDELGLADIICFTMKTNHASLRVMEKVGFRFERAGFYAKLPHVFFRLTAEEWRARAGV